MGDGGLNFCSPPLRSAYDTQYILTMIFRRSGSTIFVQKLWSTTVILNFVFLVCTNGSTPLNRRAASALDKKNL